MIIKNKVIETKMYKSLDNIQQLMMLKRNNLETIRHGFIVSQNTSFDHWETIESPKHVIREIVKEIFEKEKGVSV